MLFQGAHALVCLHLQGLFAEEGMPYNNFLKMAQGHILLLICQNWP